MVEIVDFQTVFPIISVYLRHNLHVPAYLHLVIPIIQTKLCTYTLKPIEYIFYQLVWPSNLITGVCIENLKIRFLTKTYLFTAGVSQCSPTAYVIQLAMTAILYFMQNTHNLEI